MSATRDAEFDDIQGLRELITFQELSFVDPFGQDPDLDSVGLEGWLSYSDNNVQYETCSAHENEKTSQMTRKCKSNPFYSPPRQTRRLVQKEKNPAEIEKAIRKNIGKDLQDAGLSCNDKPKESTS